MRWSGASASPKRLHSRRLRHSHFFLRRFAFFLGAAAGAFAFLARFFFGAGAVFFFAAISILWCLVERVLSMSARENDMIPCFFHFVKHHARIRTRSKRIRNASATHARPFPRLTFGVRSRAMSGQNDIEQETLRLNRRYLTEVVERFALCPWAPRSLQEGQVAECVFQQENPDDFAPSLARLSELEGRLEIEVALFIYPLLMLGRLDFEHFARSLRTLDHDRHEIGQVPFALAVFHPDAIPQLDDPERLIPFLRRSPYPTLQVVRTSALDRVRGAEPDGTAYLDLDVLSLPSLSGPAPLSLRERIARRNLATVEREGVATVESVITAILRDRDETAVRLGRPKRA